jgi:hypothetical protein
MSCFVFRVNFEEFGEKRMEDLPMVWIVDQVNDISIN